MHTRMHTHTHTRMRAQQRMIVYTHAIHACTQARVFWYGTSSTLGRFQLWYISVYHTAISNVCALHNATVYLGSGCIRPNLIKCKEECLGEMRNESH